MRNILLIGANGLTSREIIPRLLEQPDTRLTLFMRRTHRMTHFVSDRVSLFTGDATNAASLRQAIESQDVVVSTLGGSDLDIKTANIVKAMQDVGTRRIVAISAGGIYDELPRAFNAWDKSMVGSFRPSNLQMAQTIEDSSLIYTVLRPVWLTDDPTEAFQLTKKGEAYQGTETSRASIGRFVANVVEDPKLHANENLGISRPGTDGDRPQAYAR